ncbi:MAG: hypothetical protein V4667_06760 [Bacteroidota bacterium]
MAETYLTTTAIGNDRISIRKNIINLFLQENPGTGIGELTARYFYNVEKTACGIEIYLKRPAPLNKGMDFEIHAKNFNFRTENVYVKVRSRPKHVTIISDLKAKKEENINEYAKVKNVIDKIYNCQNVTDEEMTSLNFTIGFPIELVLKLIKWLFIEQDVTYWHASGRAKFYNGILEI